MCGLTLGIELLYHDKSMCGFPFLVGAIKSILLAYPVVVSCWASHVMLPIGALLCDELRIAIQSGLIAFDLYQIMIATVYNPL